MTRRLVVFLRAIIVCGGSRSAQSSQPATEALSWSLLRERSPSGGGYRSTTILGALGGAMAVAAARRWKAGGGCA